MLAQSALDSLAQHIFSLTQLHNAQTGILQITILSHDVSRLLPHRGNAGKPVSDFSSILCLFSLILITLAYHPILSLCVLPGNDLGEQGLASISPGLLAGIMNQYLITTEKAVPRLPVVPAAVGKHHRQKQLRGERVQCALWLQTDGSGMEGGRGTVASSGCDGRSRNLRGRIFHHRLEG